MNISSVTESNESPSNEGLEESKETSLVAKVVLDVFLAMSFGLGFVGLTRKKKPYIYQIPEQPTLEIPIDDLPIDSTPKPTGQPICLCSEEEKAKIVEIFTVVAEGGLNLVWPSVQKKLKDLGKEIDAVHPFSFLIAAPRSYVRQIFQGMNTMKKKGVMEGIREKMVLRKSKNELFCYIPSFANAMKKNPEKIRDLIQHDHWGGLVDYLYDLGI